MKQALVRQGMYREQENSHLEWPDYIRGITSTSNEVFVFICSTSDPTPESHPEGLLQRITSVPTVLLWVKQSLREVFESKIFGR